MAWKLCFGVGVVLLLVSLSSASTPVAQEDDDIVGEIKKKQAEKSGGETPEKPNETPKKPAGKDAEPEAVAPEDGLVLKGTRVILPEIAEGSWCAGGWNLLDEAATAEVAGLKLVREKKGVQLTGHFKDSKAARKRQAFKPSTFAVTVVDGVEKTETKSLKDRDLAKGVDIEICGPDLKGMLVIRIEENWRGVVWGVISGYEFKLEKETITLADADLDGRCSTGDRIIYGDRTIWMPWHTVTASGKTIYHELAVANSTSLTARIAEMADPGDDKAVWDAWQEERKNQGVPPGLFSLKRKQACIKHADYLKVNDVRGHSEDPALPGYSQEGHDAGMSSCISFAGPKGAMWSFLDSLYHRPQLIDPDNVVLQLGGNDYAYLMGYTTDGELPTESRAVEAPQLHPAPSSTVPNGTYNRYENPTHPILASAKAPGLPVIVRVPAYEPSFSGVDCHLYAVAGDMRTGKRGAEVRCHLSHAGKDAPQGFPSMWSMIALTPYEVLKPATYEASFKFIEGGQQQIHTWRFAVGN